MTNIIKQSLEQNMDAILENVPVELHEEVKANIASAAPTPKLSMAEVKQAVIQELKDNPTVDDAACIPMVETDESLGQAAAQPSAEELEAEQATRLAETMKECGLTSLPTE